MGSIIPFQARDAILEGTRRTKEHAHRAARMFIVGVAVTITINLDNRALYVLARKLVRKPYGLAQGPQLEE